LNSCATDAYAIPAPFSVMRAVIVEINSLFSRRLCCYWVLINWINFILVLVDILVAVYCYFNNNSTHDTKGGRNCVCVCSTWVQLLLLVGIVSFLCNSLRAVVCFGAFIFLSLYFLSACDLRIPITPLAVRLAWWEFEHWIWNCFEFHSCHGWHLSRYKKLIKNILHTKYINLKHNRSSSVHLLQNFKRHVKIKRCSR
jgi:hypothetical protein